MSEAAAQDHDASGGAMGGDGSRDQGDQQQQQST